MIGARESSKRKRVRSVSSPQNAVKKQKEDENDYLMLEQLPSSKVVVTPLKWKYKHTGNISVKKVASRVDHNESEKALTELRRSKRKMRTAQAVTAIVETENIPQKSAIKVIKEEKKESEVAMEIQEEVEEEIKGEMNSDDLSSDSDDEEGDGVSTYERRRLKNIQENAKFFASLGIFQAKEKLQESVGVPKSDVKKPSRNGLKGIKAKTPEPVPRRLPSLRLRGLDPHGTPIPEVPKEPEQEVERHPRRPAGPMEVIPSNIGDDKESAVFERTVSAICKSEIKPCKNTPELDRFVGQVAKMTISEDRVAKVVPDRIFSIAIHPSASKTLVFAGSKWGSLGLWDLDANKKTTDNGVYKFEPHSRPISCLALPKHQPDKLYSCSYDGTVRCADFNKMVFDEVYSTTYGVDAWFSYLDFLSEDGSELVVGQMANRDGCIAVVDTRSNRKTAESVYGVHNRSVKTVSVHPTQRHYLITASTDSTVAVWDIRNMKGGGKSNKALVSVPHTRSVSSAFFSPLTGNKIVTTAYDDRLRVLNFSTTENGQTVETEVKKSVRHDNQVGRWLTPFKAVWHPSREDVFVCGSMRRPRQIEVYNEHCHNVHNFRDEENLGSVCSLNVFHPTRNIIAGGNSSGRVHVFM